MRMVLGGICGYGESTLRDLHTNADEFPAGLAIYVSKP
jgi:hypothetical protein